MRQVYAPQMAEVIAGECLKNYPAAHPMGHAGLDHDLRPRMAHRAPYRAGQGTLGVAVPAVGMAARPESLGGQQFADVRQEAVELLRFRARPRRAEQAMQVLIP